MSSGFGDKKGLTFPLDKIFFMLACFYLGLVVSWLFYQSKIPVEPTSEKVSQPPVLSASQKQFIAYLQQSLRQIDRQAKTRDVQTATLPQATVAVPPPPPQRAASPQEKIIERIYVPVYPAATPKVGPSPQVRTSVTPPEPVRTAVVIPPPPPVNMPAPQSLPSPVSVPPLVTGDSTLVGVLELGAQSAALFQIQDTTKRVVIGESINGWTLVGVQQEKVILSRNGQQRSLAVGQRF